jgi:hypothetical protein
MQHFRNIKKILFHFNVLAVCAFAAQWIGVSHAYAGYFEISGGAFYTKSTYTDSDYNWTRRYGANAGYHLTDTTEIEFTFQDVTDRTVLTGYEDTTFHDQIYGITWNQAIFGKGVAVQPYFKVGIGELNRTATGSYTGGAAPPSELDEVTAIIGVGIRIYLTKAFGLRGEAISYLDEGRISTYKDNVSTTVGVSFYF